MKTVESFNVQIWVGLRKEYSDVVYTVDMVRLICDEWVNDVKDCVTITPTEFRYVYGSEPGVIVGYINYPRFPRTNMEITDRAIALANKLRRGLGQIRVSVVTPTITYLLEDE
jgi:hypothetical protein